MIITKSDFIDVNLMKFLKKKIKVYRKEFHDNLIQSISLYPRIKREVMVRIHGNGYKRNVDSNHEFCESFLNLCNDIFVRSTFNP